jgi:hypothetical protein
MKGGPATSAGPTLYSVITGIIRKARSDCMDPVWAQLESHPESAAAQGMASMAFRRAAYSCFEIAPASNRILSSKSASVGEADGGNTGAGSGCAFAAAGNASPRSETMSPVFMDEVLKSSTSVSSRKAFSVPMNQNNRKGRCNSRGKEQSRTPRSK